MNSKYDGWEFLYEIDEEAIERSRQYKKSREEEKRRETTQLIIIGVLWMPVLYAIAKVLDFLEKANWL